MESLSRKATGDQAEQAALAHLQRAGLKLVERNFRCRGGELDLVMLDQQVLVFVEVRYRRDHRFGGAAASVGITKQQRLLIAAQRYLQSHPALQRLRARFDVVTLHSEAQPDLQWLKDAFRP